MQWKDFVGIQTRRSFLTQCAGGLGTVALWDLLQREARATPAGEAVNPLAPRKPHFTPKAKNVIFMFMEGGPSQIDLFDPKPALQRWNQQSLPESMRKDLRFSQIKPNAKIWASPRTFQPHGQCGTEICDLLPHLAGSVDDMAVIRSMYCEQFNHHPGQLLLHCGSPMVGRPSMGAWALYGLGSEAENLPGFVVLSSGRGASGSTGLFSSGFLPSMYQGVPFRNSGDPVLHLSNPPGMSPEEQRARLDALKDLNQQRYSETGDVEIASRIASYELAFRMQTAAPELLDLSKESPATMQMYGVGKEPDKTFATNCLLARRLVERGTRFVLISHASWDDHHNLHKSLKKNCELTDQPTAALLKDLKQRGLLEQTLVIWGGEFGRTPLAQMERPGEEETMGRDHHPAAFTMWMAGGGIKGGQVIGKTDELCLDVVEDKIHVHDMHATMLHCLGLNHERLTYRYQGRDFRLTDVAGQVAKKLLA